MGLLRPSICTAVKAGMQDCIKDIGLEMLRDTVAKEVVQMPFAIDSIVQPIWELIDDMEG